MVGAFGQLAQQRDSAQFRSNALFVTVTTVELAYQCPGKAIELRQPCVVRDHDLVDMVFQPGPKVRDWSGATYKIGDNVLKLS
jgi:hypothetical protein